MLTPGPGGQGWIPPVGSRACAHQGPSGLHSKGRGAQRGPELDSWKDGPVTQHPGLLGRSGVFGALGLVNKGDGKAVPGFSPYGSPPPLAQGPLREAAVM